MLVSLIARKMLTSFARHAIFQFLQLLIHSIIALLDGDKYNQISVHSALICATRLTPRWFKNIPHYFQYLSSQ